MRVLLGAKGFGVTVVVAVALITGAGQWKSPHESKASSRDAGLAVAASDHLPVNGGKPLEVPVSLFVSGRVDGLAAGSSLTRVRIFAGGRTFNAAISGNTYSATLGGLVHADMVWVEAEAPGVRYRSLVGSFLDLKRDSRGDRKVTLAEHPELRVSPWSTAVEWLVRRGLAGRMPSSSVELHRVLASIDGMDAMNMAYVMAAFAEGALDPMPPHATGIELVEDEDAYRSLLRRGAASSAPTWMSAQADGIPLATLSELPAAFALMGPVPLDDVTARQSAWIFTAKGGNVWQAANGEPGPTSDLDASLQEGRVRLVPRSPWTRDRFDGSPYGSTLIRQQLQSLELVQLTGARSASRGLWRIQRHWLDTYPNIPDSTPRPWSEEPLVLYGQDLDARSWPIAWATAGQVRALPWTCRDDVFVGAVEPFLGVCEYVLHEFAANGAGVLLDHGPKVDRDLVPQPGGPGPTFQWSKGPGNRLRISSTAATTTFWLLDPADNAHPRLAYVASGEGGERMAGVSFALQDESPSFVAGDFVGSWLSDDSIALPIRYPEPALVTILERNTDGSGQQRGANSSGQAYAISQRWSAGNGAVMDARFRARLPEGNEVAVADCESAIEAGASSCYVERVRYFRPLKVEGARVFGIEHYYYNPDYLHEQDTRALLGWSRAAFYECDEGACTNQLAANTKSWAAAGLHLPARVRASPIPPGTAEKAHGEEVPAPASPSGDAGVPRGRHEPAQAPRVDPGPGAFLPTVLEGRSRPGAAGFARPVIVGQDWLPVETGRFLLEAPRRP